MVSISRVTIALAGTFLFLSIYSRNLFAQTNVFPASGNVGIGTTSPAFPLDVTGAIGSNSIPVSQAGSISLTADGTYQIAAGTALNGVYTIDWYGPYRAEHYQVSVISNQYDNAVVSVLSAYSYGGSTVLSNFRVVSDSGGSGRYFVVDVANRDGGAGSMYVTASGATACLLLSASPSGSASIPNSFLVLGDRTGQVGIGTQTPAYTLDVNGTIRSVAGLVFTSPGPNITFPDATIQATAWNGVLTGGDYAESVDVTGAREKYQPGDVLVIDPASEGKFLKSSKPYSTAVTGIYSTRPGVVGRRQLSARAHMRDEVPMAMTGIVPTRVSAENGPIKPGDFLVTSSKPGYAMKGTDRAQMLGAVIGKAIGHLDSGVGVIEAVVTLQ